MTQSGDAVIGLITDFGTRDPYVAAIKAVLASRCDAPILDLTHEIPSFDVFEAAFFLQSILAYLQTKRFVIVAVVDPGVGSARKILAMERNRQVFLAPDNGLLSLVADAESRIWSVENERLFLAGRSATFHARDRFAPVAAAIVNGFPIEQTGPELQRSDIVRLDYAPPDFADGKIRGRVISVDHYGNAITDIPATLLGDPDHVDLRVRHHRVSAFARTYQEGRRAGGPFVIVGSRGTIEISISSGSAADVLQIARFDPVEIHQRK